MNEFCANCGLCCKLIPVVNGMMLRNGFQEPFVFMEKLSQEESQNINGDFVAKVQFQFPDAEFYKCNYISEDNICKNDSMELDCISYPSHPMSIVPDECQFLGEIFIKNEEIRHKIRKYKEEITYYKSMISPDNKDNETNEKIIKSIQRFVDKYIPYGAENW